MFILPKKVRTISTVLLFFYFKSCTRSTFKTCIKNHIFGSIKNDSGVIVDNHITLSLGRSDIATDIDIFAGYISAGGNCFILNKNILIQYTKVV